MLEGPVTLRWWLFSAAVLAIASVVALTFLGTVDVIPSVVRDPLSQFVGPGVALWWLVLGGPFRSAPSSPSGVVFAAAANAALWLPLFWIAVAIVRAVRRWIVPPSS
jgi:hypothetical protein